MSRTSGLKKSLVPLAFAWAFPGCAIPDLPRISPDMGEPPHPVVFLKAHGGEDGAGEVLLGDLCAAHGLDSQIDKVTGHRFLTDGIGNRVVIAPGTHEVTINGTLYPLLGEIHWRQGQIYLPGDARVVFGEHLKRDNLASLDDYRYLDSLDENKFLKGFMPGPTPTTHKGAHAAGIRIDPNAPPLPASWNVSAHRQWDWIVIHHSATPEGGAASFNRSHRKKWENGLGYHFVIGNGTETKDGETEVGSRWLRQNEGIDGAHAGVEKYNKHGIGVCLVGDFDKTRPTPRQLAALRNLCVHLMQRYGIPKDHIIPHRAVKSGHTECPGTSFPLDEFLRSF